ncbi:hypothetical protein AAF712_009910 [Marasmius tenuissimus]|uniref:Uncharacterized protein n=1 Tax=Marasmius tenuissimus TaxID=585030 RepID=A0ABR2ZNI0_9AGAR
MPPLARRAEQADSGPNVALIVGLTVGGILLIVSVVSAILFIRRRRRRRPQPVRSVSAHRFNIDVEKPDPEALQPLHNPFETDADHRYRRQSHPGIGHPKVYLSYEESPTLPDFDTTALLQEQQPNPHSSPFPSPLSSTFGRQDELETRPTSSSVSPKSLPRLTIPNSPKHVTTTSQHDSDSAVEATLYAPGTSENLAHAHVQASTITPIHSSQRSASPPTPRPAPPKFNREPTPVQADSESESDTDSAYSQGSASTRLHGDFSSSSRIPRNGTGTPPPPVPALPEYLRRPTAREEEEEEEDGNELQRVPTVLIAGLLKKRARRSGSGGPPTRQLSRVSRIERSDSIMSYRADSQSQGDDSTSGLRPHRRSTKRRRLKDPSEGHVDLAVEGLKTVWEREPNCAEPNSAVTATLPNPFGAALSPTVSPSTTRPPTPGSEHVVLCYQPEVSKSDSVTSESVQPLRMSKRVSASVGRS